MLGCFRCSCRTKILKIMDKIVRERQMSWSASTQTFMIVGLGNPDLPKTRHNVGMRAVGTLADCLDAKWTRQRSMLSMVATACLHEPAIELILVKPKVMMNINGKSIQKVASQYEVEPNRIYLLHDELDKKVGVARMKEGGSPRGHNGVRSAISHLKTDVMPRLLIGIDRPSSKNDVADYVMRPFDRDELPEVENAINDGLQRLLRHIQTNADTSCDLPRLVLKEDVKPSGASNS